VLAVPHLAMTRAAAIAAANGGEGRFMLMARLDAKGWILSLSSFSTSIGSSRSSRQSVKRIDQYCIE
jgi:hypothetical protein